MENFCKRAKHDNITDTQNVAKKLAQILNNIGILHTGEVQGTITNELWELRGSIIQRLEADGWVVGKKRTGDGYTVKWGEKLA